VGDLVIVPVGGPGQGGKFVSLAAFNKLTGEEVWRGGDDQAAYASPGVATLGGVEQILSVNENTVSAHEAATGKVLWSHPWPSSSAGDSNNSQPLAVSDDRVFVSKSYGVGSVLLEVNRSPGDKFTVSEIWRESGVLKTKFCNVVIHEGYVYGLSDGILECVELASGERAWKKGRYHHGQILGVGDVLLVMCELTGEVVMIELTSEKHVEIGRFPALESEKVWNTMAIVGPHLYVRGATTAACWKLPLADAE
jgi:outer membrane protein assembly factor BamB